VEGFRQLLAQNKADFSVLVIEKYCNIRVKYYLSQYAKDKSRATELAKEIDAVIEELKFLTDHFGETEERLSLMGSAHKRKAMMLSGARKQAAYKHAATSYLAAYKWKDRNSWYPFTNWLSIENALVYAGAKTWKDIPGKMAGSLDALLKMYEGNERRIADADQVDFWDMVAGANIQLCRMLIDTKSVPFNEVLAAYKKAWGVVGNIGNKQAEIEHLEFLEDALGMAPATAKGSPLPLVTKLKEMLKGMV
jgi:hypothetical protein